MMNLNEASFADIQAELQRRGVSGVLLTIDINGDLQSHQFGSTTATLGMVDVYHSRLRDKFLENARKWDAEQ